MAETYSVEAVLSARDQGFTAGMKAAGKAANSLGSKFKNVMGASKSLGDTIKGTALGMGAFKAASAAVSTLTSHLDSAIDRYDTMNQFPKVMGNLGISTKKSNAAIKKLSNGLTGLPTTLDSAASGVTNFTSKNGDIKKSTDYFLALNNAIVAGGQSQAIQSTAMEQLSQAYSKGKMDMMEWRSLQTAMPAQLKQVATAMGMTTDQLGEGLRKGTVSMDDFMGTIVKLNDKGVKGFASFSEQAKSATGGIKTAITNMGTAVTRGVANCLGSFDKLLQNNGFPTLGEMITDVSSIIGNAFKKVSGAIESINISGIIEVAMPYWDAFSGAVEKVASSCGKAFGSIASSLGDFLSKQSTLETFSSIVSGVGDTISTIANIVADNSDKIVGAIPYIIAFGLAFKGIKAATSVVKGVKGFIDNVGKIQGALSPATEVLQPFPNTMTETGKSCSMSATQILSSAVAFIALGAGIAIAALGLSVLATAAINLAAAGPLAIGVMAGMVLSLGLLMKLASTLGPQLSTGAAGFLAFGAAIVLVAAGFAILTASAIALSNGGNMAMVCMLGMVVAIGALMGVAAALAPALSAGAAGFLALGAAAVMIGAGMALASVLVNSLTAFISQLGATISQIAAAITVAVTAIAAAIGATLVSVIQTAGNTITQVLTSVGNVFTTLSTAVTKVVNAISGGFTSVLDGVAKVIGSIGTAAKNAGTGFLSVANGIKVISGLSLGAIAKSLGAVSVGLSKIAKHGSGVSKTASGLSSLISAVSSASSSFSSLGSKASSAMSQVKSAMNGAASSAKSSGKKVATGFSQSMQSGFSKATSIAAKATKAVGTKLRSGYSSARSSGAYISKGFASGMSSCLGQIEAAASRMVAAADKAIRAKAKIHSPSRLTKSHGKNIAIGLGLGIRSGISAVTKESKALVSSVESVLKNATASRTYESAASNAIDKFKTALEKKVTKTTKSLNKKINSGIKKLQKENPKLGKEYSKIGKLLKSDFSKTIKNQSKKAISAADKALTALGKKYQEKYDQIISDRSNFQSKLADYGSLYSVDSYGYIEFKDFSAQTKQVKELGKNMEYLKKVLPYDLLIDIQDMDTSSALSYTNQLLKQGDAWLKQYGKDYTSFINTTKSVSSQYYQPYITQLDKDYNSAVTQELNKLKKQMNQIAQDATSGFIKGLTSKSSKKALKKAANNLANILTNAVKGKLKIHSPSRVFASLGEYTGQGFINGLAAMKKDIADTMDNIISIPTNPNLAIAGDVGGELSSAYDYYGNAEYTIVVPVEVDGKEVAKVTAPYTEAELNKRQQREERKRGRR